MKISSGFVADRVDRPIIHPTISPSVTVPCSPLLLGADQKYFLKRKKYETAPEILFEHKMRRKRYETAPEILFQHKIRRKNYDTTPEILFEHKMKRKKYETTPEILS